MIGHTSSHQHFVKFAVFFTFLQNSWNYSAAFNPTLVTIVEREIMSSAFGLTTGYRSQFAKKTLLEMSNSPTSVAIIGGGVAGLSCASHLASSNHYSQVVVFDTGRLRPGGRCSSRYPNDPPSDGIKSRATILGSHVIDHAAQILSVSSSSLGQSSPFANQVKEWEKDGILKRFPKGSVCEILKGTNNEDTLNAPVIKPINGDSSETIMYYGANGMGDIPKAMINNAGFQIKQDVWVSPSNGVKYLSEKKIGKSQSYSPTWRIKAKGKTLGDFDHIVIAHNGKCADRLMSKTPAKALHSLLRTNFSPTVPKHGGKRMTLNSIYSLTFALKADKDEKNTTLGLPSNVISAFIQNENNLRFLSCNTKKYPPSRSSSSSSPVQIWTLLSSPKFASKHKGPQENLPTQTVQEVTFLMLDSLEKSLHLEKGTLTTNEKEVSNIILDTKLQLWGAAVPLNTWHSKGRINNGNDNDREGCDDVLSAEPNGFLYDDEYGVGACGDWLLESSIEGAWESGRRLAKWMIEIDIQRASNKITSDKRFSVGLPPDGSFLASQSVAKEGIGSIKNLDN